MKRSIIMKDGDINKFQNVKGFIEMNLHKRFDDLYCQVVDEDYKVTIFTVKTRKKNFEFIKNQLDNLYPKSFVYLQSKARA